MRAKSRRVGVVRTGNIQTILGGLVLFTSGTMLGGYVVWSQLKGDGGLEGNLQDYQTYSQSDESSANVEIPRAHAIGTKSYQVIVPHRDGTGDAAPISTKWAPVFTPDDISPPTAMPMGTKSGMMIAPKDVKFPAGIAAQGSKEASAPNHGWQPTGTPSTSFGTKSVRIFVPSEMPMTKSNANSPLSVPNNPKSVNPPLLNPKPAAPSSKLPTKPGSKF